MAVLALTMGDPAGIGGEIAIAAWRRLHREGPAFVLLADPLWLKGLDPTLALAEVATPAEAAGVFSQALPVLPLALAAPAVPGRPDPANAPAVIASIRRAVALAQAGEASAVVTNPIAKSVLYAAGFPYPGHTEFLGALTGVERPVMMLAARELKVVPVTVHLALREAIDRISTAAIVHAGRVAAAALREWFAIADPRLAVAALNPHAGEAGAMGEEEARLIAPAILELRAGGIKASGPHPPDSLFTPAARAGYDAVLGMYHDQMLIPFKTLATAEGVNLTLGLPILHSSPDHGTAFAIAGLGQADPASLIAALRLAARLAARREKRR